MGYGVGYKRRARVAFIRGCLDSLGLLAMQWANETDMLEARVVRVEEIMQHMNVLAEQDLWVTLDAPALSALPARLPGVQHRHYPFECLRGDVAHDEQVRQSLFQRVRGMAGGMHMLERMIR